MTSQTRTVLKGYFNTGDTPTEAQFANLIDSFGTEIRDVLHDEILGAAGSFDVSSISQDYDDLLLIAMLRSDVSAGFDGTRIYFNNDTTDANYHNQRSAVSDGTASALEEATPGFGETPGATSPASTFAHARIYIPNYTSTNYLKIALVQMTGLFNTAKIYTGITGVSWEDGGATAINRIMIRTDNYPTDEFVANSQLRIIGIKYSS